MKRLLFLFALLFNTLMAQGPDESYFYNRLADFGTHSMYIYHTGGSKLKIPFTMAIDRKDRAPLGIEKYSKDISVDAGLLFVGNGISVPDKYDSYRGKKESFANGEIDVKGRALLLCYDFKDSIETAYGEKFTLEERISYAYEKGAACVILFSHKTKFPFLFLNFQKGAKTPSIPVLVITEESAQDIFLSAGINWEKMIQKWIKTGMPPASNELIIKVKVKVDGMFQSVKTPHFVFRWRNEDYSRLNMKHIAGLNEKAYNFIIGTFPSLKQERDKMFITYFKGFDTKLFYTHHWGKGLACDAGIFNVSVGEVPNYGLAVHENMHILWGTNSTSFLSEGIAMYAEALATDKNKNDAATLSYYKQNKLFQLKEMLSFTIGLPGEKTEIGYPAAGSFVGFLVRTYGLLSFRNLCLYEARKESEKINDDSWVKAFGKTIDSLEKEWHGYLIK